MKIQHEVIRTKTNEVYTSKERVAFWARVWGCTTGAAAEQMVRRLGWGDYHVRAV